MAFPGREQMDKDATPSSAWVKLVDDQPVRVTICGYVGKVTSKKYPDKAQYRFQAQVAGEPRHLDCNWRLMKALLELVEHVNAAFEVTVTQSKAIEDVKNPADGSVKKTLVNHYTLTNMVPVPDNGTTV